jgi:hypothetical protein
MEQYGLAPEDIGATAGDVSAAKRRWWIARAKAALRRMATGNPTYGPWYFDWTMDRFGLEPEDISATAADVAAAKRQWGVERAKAVLSWMAAGDPDYGPSNFDSTMDRFGLAPADIGATDDEVAAAKRRWGVEQTKAALSEMAAADPSYSPSYFDWMMDQFGLAPKDIGATAAEVDAAKRRWMQHRTSQDARGLTRS